MVLFVELAKPGDYELAQIGSNPFLLGQPQQTHQNFFFLNAREGQKYIFLKIAPRWAPVVTLRRARIRQSNPMGRSYSMDSFWQQMLSNLTATAGHLTAILIMKHSEYRLKSSNQETAYKIIKSWKQQLMWTFVANILSKYTTNEENTQFLQLCSMSTYHY